MNIMSPSSAARRFFIAASSSFEKNLSICDVSAPFSGFEVREPLGSVLFYKFYQLVDLAA